MRLRWFCNGFTVCFCIWGMAMMADMAMGQDARGLPRKVSGGLAIAGMIQERGYPTDKELREALDLALKYLDPKIPQITTSYGVEYCDELCQAERTVERIKQRRQDIETIRNVLKRMQ